MSAPDSSDEEAGGPWIVCLQTGVLEALWVGRHVDIDDGHIVTRVEAVDANEARLRVLTTRRPEGRVRADQGLNFPNSPICGQRFGPDDLLALDVAADIAARRERGRSCPRDLGEGQQVAVEGRLQPRQWDAHRSTLYWKTGRHANRPRQPGIYSAQPASTW